MSALSNLAHVRLQTVVVMRDEVYQRSSSKHFVLVISWKGTEEGNLTIAVDKKLAGGLDDKLETPLVVAVVLVVVVGGYVEERVLSDKELDEELPDEEMMEEISDEDEKLEEVMSGEEMMEEGLVEDEKLKEVLRGEDSDEVELDEELKTVDHHPSQRNTVGYSRSSDASS